MITAIVLLNVEPGRIKSVADDLLAIDGVTEVYSVAGPYDLVAMVRVREHDQLSDLVTERSPRGRGSSAANADRVPRLRQTRRLGLLWDVGTG